MRMSSLRCTLWLLLASASAANELDCPAQRDGECVAEAATGHAMIQVRETKADVNRMQLQEDAHAGTEADGLAVVKGPTCAACLAENMPCQKSKERCDVEADKAACAAFGSCKAKAIGACMKTKICQSKTEAEHEAAEVFPTTMLMKTKAAKNQAKGPNCGACLADTMDCLEDKQKCDSALQFGEDTSICAPFNKCKDDAKSKCISAGSCSEAEAKLEADEVYPTTMLQKIKAHDPICASCLTEEMDCMNEKTKCDKSPSDCDSFRKCETNAKSQCVKQGACSSDAESQKEISQIESGLSDHQLSLMHTAKDQQCGACLTEEMNCKGDMEKCLMNPRLCDAAWMCKANAKARCVKQGACSEADARKEFLLMEHGSSQARKKALLQKRAPTQKCGACLMEEMNCLADIVKCNKDPSNCAASDKCEADATARCVKDGACSAADAQKEINQMESDIGQAK